MRARELGGLPHAVPMDAERPVPDRPLPAELRGPFTPATAAAAGIGRTVLERLVREGRVRKLFRGVYAEAGQLRTLEDRAAAVALAIGAGQIAVGRTAAWLHGADAEALTVGLGPGSMLPLEVRGLVRNRSARLPGTSPRPPIDVGGILAMPPVETALELALRLDATPALAALDALLRCRAVRHADLLGAAAQVPVRSPGIAHGDLAARRLRELCARSDPRSRDAAESALRQCWFDARLPTPVPGLRVGGVRVALALPVQRFAVVVRPLAPRERCRIRHLGWHVSLLEGRRVLATSPEHVRGQLEREFHQHLLRVLEAQVPKAPA